ncbi:MAG: serine protease [Firmicutes bacterium]|nr:serine protease [Bacillota bacterium]
MNDSFILILFIGVLISFVSYGTIPFLYLKAADKPILRKKYRKVCIASGFAVMIFFAIVNYTLYGIIKISIMPATIWTGIIYKLTANKTVSESDISPRDFIGETSILELRKQEKKGRKRFVMVIIIAVAVAVFFVLYAIGTKEKEQYPASIPISDAAEAVLYLEVYDENGYILSTGSGFLVNDDRTLVTNYHVIDDAYYMEAYAENGEKASVSTVILYDEVADLAILRMDGPLNVMPLPVVDSDTVRKGDEIYTAGYPLGIANTLADGIVSARYRDYYDVDTIQITAAISGGNSGGPLLNKDGHVVGVVCASYTEGQNLNLAIASNTLTALMEKEDVNIRLNEWTDRPVLAGEEGYNDTNDVTPVAEIVPAPDEEEGKNEPVPEAEPATQPEAVPKPAPEPTPTPLPEAEPAPEEESVDISTLPPLAVSSNEVTTSGPVKITVTCPALVERSGVLSVKYPTEDMSVSWGAKNGPYISLQLIPFKTGEINVRVYLKEDPSVFEDIKVISQ